MELQRQVYTYYKRKMYRGRSALARAADFVFLRLFFFAAVYLIFLYFLHIIWLSVFLSALLTVSLSLALQIWKGLRLNRYIDAEMGKLKKECLLESIVMMENTEYRRMVKKILKNMGFGKITANTVGYEAEKDGEKYFARAYFTLPSEQTGAGDILSAFKVAKKLAAEKVLLLSPSGFTREALVFAKRHACISLIASDEFLSLAAEAGFNTDEEQANEAAMNAIRSNAVTPDDIREAVLKSGKSKAYMLCGIFALVWSYIAGFQFYYPLIAIACFVLAFLIRRKEDSGKKAAL
jgi:hypothetical protein